MVYVGMFGSEERHWTYEQAEKVFAFINHVYDCLERDEYPIPPFRFEYKNSGRWEISSDTKEMYGNFLDSRITLVSGGCKYGGVDIWAEELALERDYETLIHEPNVERWFVPGMYGYKLRNIDIAKSLDIGYCIEPIWKPEFIYRGDDHVFQLGELPICRRSGGIFTMNFAKDDLKKSVYLVVIK